MDEVINYVMDTPGNTNPNVLRGMLEKSGSNDRFVVTYSTSDMTTWTCDKTFAQITEAMAAGKQIVLIGSVGGTPIAQGCDVLLSGDGSYYIEFWIRYRLIHWYCIVHHDDDSISFYDTAINYNDVGAVAVEQGMAYANKVLMVNDAGWVMPEDNRLVVTLTPTAQDFSGVMDKTPEEITAAYNAGKEIRVTVPELGGLTGICTEFSPDSGSETVSLWCNFTANFSELGGDVLIVVITSHTTSTYSTKIFSLTPING